VNVIKSLYDNVTTAVKNMHGESGQFGVKVGVHQGSVMSPLLFTMVLEALSRVFRVGRRGAPLGFIARGGRSEMRSATV